MPVTKNPKSKHPLLKYFSTLSSTEIGLNFHFPNLKTQFREEQNPNPASANP
jgi:hypothetical protein